MAPATRRPGRPRTRPEQPCSVTTYLAPDVRAALGRLAEAQGTSVSRAVESIVARAVRAWERRHPL